MVLSGDPHAAGLVELGHGHLRRVLARGTDGGNVAAQLGDHADGQIREPLFSAGPEHRRAGNEEEGERGESFHGGVLPSTLISGTSSIPNLSITVFFISSINARTSAAVAPPRFTMTFA